MTLDNQSLVAELLELEAGLTAWEIEFLDNLYKNRRDRDLQLGQIRKLQQIALKHGLIE